MGSGSNEGMFKIAKIQKWGNSLGVRIPQSVAEEIGIYNGSLIELTTNKNTIVLKPVDNKPTLEELCSKITEENKHGVIDFGKPKGKEIW